MLSRIPFNLSAEGSDKEILRISIIAELDAINLYEQLAIAAKNDLVKKVLLDIANEEKVHVGEFQELLVNIDDEHATSLEKGKQEVSELRG